VNIYTDVDRARLASELLAGAPPGTTLTQLRGHMPYHCTLHGRLSDGRGYILLLTTGESCLYVGPVALYAGEEYLPRHDYARMNRCYAAREITAPLVAAEFARLFADYLHPLEVPWSATPDRNISP
jgi:hypothetical protein